MLQGAIMSSAVYSPINNKVYVFGGEDAATGTNYNLTQIYDIISGTWSMGPNMPDVRSFMASGYYNGKIYLVAGYNTGFVDSAQRQVWEYDPIANTFTTTRMLYPNTNGVGGPGFGIINGHLYVAGGRDLTNTVIALVYDYDIGADTWTQRASLPSANNVPGSGVENGLLAVFGGGNPFAFAPATTGATVLYDPGSDTWSAGPTLSVARSFPAGTNVGNTLVAAGGFTGASTTSATETSACTAGGGCPFCPLYTITTSTGNAIVPGDTDIGNHCDDCATPITLPFPVTVYGATFTTANVSSNGSVDLVGNASPFGTSCPLPDGRIDESILPFQGDLFTTNAGFGIFTSISGVAPNRIFNIEWRAQYFPGTGNANFEVRLYETGACFDVIYGATDDSGSAEESGVQKSATGPATQFSCLEGTLTSGLKVTYCPHDCPAPVPTDAVSRKVHGGAGTFDIELPRVPIDGAVGIEDRTQGTAGPVLLWYNGDFDNVNGLANGQNTGFNAAVYDNFNVTDAGGWDITALFTNNLLTTAAGITTANWEIRTGVSEGNAGTLLFSALNAPATVTATGRSGFGLTEYTVKVTGLSVHLDPLPAGQFYWISVQPIGDGSEVSYNSSTIGVNCVGTPCGNDDNAFFNSSDFGYFYHTTTDPAFAPGNIDFSDGVIGTGASGGGGFAHQIVVTFANDVTMDSASVTAGNGTVDSFTVSGNVVTVNLSGVTNAQRLGVTLFNVCDGTVAGDVLIPMGVLSGDTNANGAVNASDVSQTKSQSGAVVGAGNFREDVNANGSINAGDIALVKSKVGTALPP